MPGQPIPYRQWGVDLDANALQQMENACKLPVSVAAALLPDAFIVATSMKLRGRSPTERYSLEWSKFCNPGESPASVPV